MRTKKAIINTLSSILSYIILSGMVFLVQRVFKNTLGVEYLGLDGLFNNIISCLSIAELGFGSAIVVNLYKPIADNDILEIKSLMGFYKRVYYYIAVVVFVAGIAILPFIDKIIGTVSLPINIKLLYLLYLFDVVVSYFVTYKRSMIYANQQSYYITSVHTIINLLMHTLRIITLIRIRSYYVYIVISIVLRLIENIIINIIANKLYPYLKDKDIKPLSENIKKDIFRKVKGLSIHRISSYIVNGTDNIIISMVPGLGVIMVGVYSSYAIISNKLQGIIVTIFGSITSSIGNLLAEDNKENNYTVFCNINYIVTWFYIFSVISYYYISFPFIEIWMGKEMVLDRITVLVIVIMFFSSGIGLGFHLFKEAAGIFYEDRYIAIAEGIINLIISIPLGFRLGLKGVFIGTICAKSAAFVYTYPKYLYRDVLEKDLKTYCKDLAKILLRLLICFIVTNYVMTFVNATDVFLKLIITLIICVIVPNITMILITYRTNEFKYFKNLILLIIRKKI